MVEMLVSLVIFMVIASLIVQIFSIVYKTNKHQVQLKEWEIFSQQLQGELRSSKAQMVVDNKLYLLINEGLATIEHYRNMVRRQVDGGGHEIMLQNVSDFQIAQEGNQIFVQVTDFEEHQYSRTFHPFIKKGFIEK